MPPTQNEMLVKKFILFILAAIILQSCMFPGSEGYHAYFCTTTPSHAKRFLFVDDKQVGILPYNAEVPECDQMPRNDLAVYTKLSAGEHLVEIKTAHGAVLFSEELEVSRSDRSSHIRSSVEKPGWDTKVKVKDDRIIIELIH